MIRHLIEGFLPEELTTLYQVPAGVFQEIEYGCLNNQNNTTETVTLQILRADGVTAVPLCPKEYSMTTKAFSDGIGVKQILQPGDKLQGSATTAEKVFHSIRLVN